MKFAIYLFNINKMDTRKYFSKKFSSFENKRKAAIRSQRSQIIHPQLEWSYSQLPLATEYVDSGSRLFDCYLATTRDCISWSKTTKRLANPSSKLKAKTRNSKALIKIVLIMLWLNRGKATLRDKLTRIVLITYLRILKS